MLRLGRDRDLYPARALTTWSWITALALLGLNDHWAKHAGVLPGWFTGKLSDVVGLYLAPALLAALLCVRSERALFACHAAVLAGFAAINLDPGCAALSVRVLRHFGFEWRVITDAEDLIALPALLASWRWLRPAMRAPATVGTRAAVQHALAGVGLLLCMATSDESDGVWNLSSDGAPHLHNASDAEITVLVRELRESVALDCEVIAEDPAGRIPDAAFGVAYAERIAARGNAVLRSQEGRRCAAVLLSGTGLSPVMLFWSAGSDFAESIPMEYERPEEWLSGAVVITFDGERHTGYRSVGGDLVHELDRAAPELSESCAGASEGARPTASTGLLTGRRVRLLRVDEGPDGCVALQVEGLPAGVRGGEPADADAGASPVPDGDHDAGLGADDDAGVEPPAPEPEPEPGPVAPADPMPGSSPETSSPVEYVCLPRGMFPFRAGDAIEVDRGPEAGRIHIVQEDAAGLPRVELSIAPLRETAFIAGLDFTVSKRSECPYTRNERCAQTTAPALVEVQHTGGRLTLRGGEAPEHVSLRDAELELAVPFSQVRPLLDTACAGGLDEPGADAAVVIVTRWGGR